MWRADAADGERTLLAFVPAAAPGSTAGVSYRYVDTTAEPGRVYWYWLEDVDLSGATTLHGPVVVTVGTPNAVGLTGFGAAAAGPSLVGLAALALAGAGLRRRAEKGVTTNERD